VVTSPFGLLATAAAAAMQPGAAIAAPDAHALALANRLFPTLEAIQPERLPTAARKLLANRSRRIGGCGPKESSCIVRESVWTPPEIAALTAAAADRGIFETENPLPDDGAEAQLRRELTGLNSVLQVYGQGQPSRNPKIDGPVDQAGQPAFAARVATAVEIARTEGPDSGVDSSIALAVALLDVNDQDEAIAFEPLDGRYNAAARTYAATIDWSARPFTAIVVLGNGPEIDGEALSPRGKLRVKLAAARFASGAAPLIVVSGGAVHPRGTRFSEALEMKRALVKRYGVPERSIVVEPYARYTSTNLRNATRLLQSFGAPLNRELVVLTDPDHSDYVASDRFHDRSVSELGYFPGRIGRRLSTAEVTLTPTAASLRIDPLDPLDP
jgi:hypothetical protein